MDRESLIVKVLENIADTLGLEFGVAVDIVVAVGDTASPIHVSGQSVPSGLEVGDILPQMEARDARQLNALGAFDNLYPGEPGEGKSSFDVKMMDIVNGIKFPIPTPKVDPKVALIVEQLRSLNPTIPYETALEAAKHLAVELQSTPKESFGSKLASAVNAQQLPIQYVPQPDIDVVDAMVQEKQNKPIVYKWQDFYNDCRRDLHIGIHNLVIDDPDINSYVRSGRNGSCPKCTSRFIKSLLIGALGLDYIRHVGVKLGTISNQKNQNKRRVARMRELEWQKLAPYHAQIKGYVLEAQRGALSFELPEIPKGV